MICESDAEFRRDLIDRLAASPIIRPVVEGKIGEEEATALAQRIGVTFDVLVLAVRVARMGLGATAKEELGLFVPTAVAGCLFAMAEQLGMAPGVLIRSMLHAVMQTTREPRPRDVGGHSSGKWGPVPGSEAFRQELEKRRPRRLFVQSKPKGTRSHSDYYHTAFDISTGLGQALQRRAAAYGAASRHLYVCQWLADLVDGLLSDLPIVHTRFADCFGDERMYVLPTIAHDHPMIAQAPAPRSESASTRETVQDVDVYEDGGAR